MTMNTRGLTLVEILLVVMIMGVLAAMTVPNLLGRGQQARISAARTDIDANLSMAIDLYELDTGKFPSAAEGLTALVEKPDDETVLMWNGPYLKRRRLPKDPWGNQYVYVFPGVHNSGGYDLYSLGPDGEESDDDIGNWETQETQRTF